MIRVLVLANESVLGNYIVSALSKEPDLEVLRVTRDDIGSRRDFSIVIAVDDELDEQEAIQPKEIFHGGTSLLLIRISLQSKIVYVDERYQLVNPAIEQLVNLFREFDRKNSGLKSGKESDRQKKMNDVQLVQAAKYNRQQTSSSFGRIFALSQVMDFHRHLAGDPGGFSRREIPLFFYAFFLQYLRLQNPKNMTLPVWQVHDTGHQT